MPTFRTTPICFKSQKSGAIKAGEMKIVCYAAREKKIRALKSLLLFWLLAGVSVLIPVAHFFLVPVFFIAGIFLAAQRWRTTEEGMEAAGACPACGKPITIGLDKSTELPQWHDCPACGEPLMLLAAQDSDTAKQ